MLWWWACFQHYHNKRMFIHPFFYQHSDHSLLLPLSLYHFTTTWHYRLLILPYLLFVSTCLINLLHVFAYLCVLLLAVILCPNNNNITFQLIVVCFFNKTKNQQQQPQQHQQISYYIQVNTGKKKYFTEAGFNNNNNNWQPKPPPLSAEGNQILGWCGWIVGGGHGIYSQEKKQIRFRFLILNNFV